MGNGDWRLEVGSLWPQSAIGCRLTAVRLQRPLWQLAPPPFPGGKRLTMLCIVRLKWRKGENVTSCAPFRWQRNWICRGVKRPENPVTCFPPGRRGPRSGAGVYEGIWRNDALCGHRRRQRRHSYSSPQSGDTTTLLYNPFTQPAAPAAPLAPERTPPLNLLNPRRLCRPISNF